MYIMKKGLIIWVIITIFLILTVLLAFIFFSNKLSDKKILGIVMPDIENYCNNILDKTCAVCASEALNIDSYSPAKFPKSGQYLREDRSASNNVQNRNEFWFEVHIPLNYKNQIHSEGSGSVAQFKMDTSGNILYRQIPMTACK